MTDVSERWNEFLITFSLPRPERGPSAWSFPLYAVGGRDTMQALYFTVDGKAFWGRI